MKYIFQKAIFALAVSFFYAFSLSAQIRITGTVNDDTGSSLPGVNVTVKGTTTGSVTDANGTYGINVPNEDAVLVFSFVGFVTQEIAVGNQRMIHVALAEGSKQFDELVIVGYGTQKKINVTGAVGIASAEDLADRTVQNVGQALQGIVPGLNLTVNTNGGQLDNTMALNIRGIGTIDDGSSSVPLILIDGVEGNMNVLNPNDIESISVLKDAASSSIYGSRAAFGVILITTKKGKAGRTNINVLSNLRFSTVTTLPKTLDSYRFAQYFNAAAANSGAGAVFTPETMQRIIDYQAGKITEGTIAVGNVWQQDQWSNANTDWYKELYKTWAPAQETSVNVSGGNETVTYYVSGGFLNQDGHLNYGRDNFKRFNMNANINIKLSEHIDLGYSTKWIREDYTKPTYLSDLWIYNIIRKWPTKPVMTPNGFPHLGTDIQELTDGGITDSQKDYLYQSLRLVIQPLKGWNINLEGNYNTYALLRHSEVLPVYAHYVDGTSYAFALGYDPAGISRVTENADKQNSMTFNAYTNYEKQLDSGHYFNIMAGVNAELNKARALAGSMTGLITVSVPTLNTATESPLTNGGYTHWANMGYFGRLNYNYMEKYLFEANLRYDGSSRFIGDNRWALFPSFSAGWNISKEDFFNVEPIDVFKLRASWGQLGNMNTKLLYPFYPELPATAQGGQWLIDGEKPNISSIPNIVSAAMTWERIESWNIGLDWGMLNNRLTGTFDVFNRKTIGMIGPAPELPATLGTTVPKINNTDMKSQGYEIELGWRDQIQNVRYGVKVFFSDAVQTVTRYPNEDKSLTQTWYAGKRVGDVWGYETVGIAKSQTEMDEHLSRVKQTYGSEWAAGDIMFADLNGDGEINGGENRVGDPGDQRIIANFTPRYNFAISADVAWKGFDLRIFLQGVGKRDYVAGYGGMMFWGTTINQNQSVGFEEHWDFFRPEGDPLGANLNAYYPRPLFAGSAKNQQVQSKYVQNAGYIRFKNLQLGYTLPVSITSNVGIQSLRIFVSGENLLTFTKLTKQFDPELLVGADNDGIVYPINKTISVGLNLNF